MVAKRNAYSKNIKRTILGSMGRYMAILVIIALGVGFFAGVKNTKPAMLLTCNQYIEELNGFDFKLISTIGFEQSDVDAIKRDKAVELAEGSYSVDFFSEDNEGNSIIIRSHSVTDEINKLDLIDGKMPVKSNECVVDEHYYSSADIGKYVEISERNDADTKDMLTHKKYKITGIAKSPLYLMKGERGSTTLGDGQISAFMYFNEAGYSTEYYTEVYVVCNEGAAAFTDEYKDVIKSKEKSVETIAVNTIDKRFQEIIDDSVAEIDEKKQELADGRKQLESEKQQAYSKLDEGKNELDSKNKEIKNGLTECKKQKDELENQKKALESQRENLQVLLTQAEKTGNVEQAAALKEGIAEIDKNLAQLNAGISKITETEKTLNEALKQVNEGYNQYYNNKSKAERSFAAAEEELFDGEKKIAEAEEEIQKLEKPDVFIQTRDDNIGMSSFESNSDIVNSIAKVFPVFFFLIAALVCSTTMTRMVEEERAQLGTLSALGYKQYDIIKKYIIYSGSAAIIGTVAGFVLGSKFFPMAIWTGYSMMYGFSDIVFYFNTALAIISLVVAIICSAGTTYLACKNQLKGMPATILRPKAPQKGKRIFLERIDFIWRRMAFLHKVTARNIFRYKKRMIMMVAGICGCTALVMAGLGLDDSVAGIANHQFDEIEKYHVITAFEDELDSKERKEFEKTIEEDVVNTAILQQVSVDIHNNSITKSINMIITDDEAITKAISFKDINEDKQIRYPKKGEAVINNKMTDILGIDVGDTVEIDCGEAKGIKLKISGIYKNYISNYIFICDDTYEDVFEEKYKPSIMYISLEDEDNVYKTAEEINKFDSVVGISLNKDVKKRVDDMMESLNFIIILVIACAGTLAFIVLFNLGNINITEREKEIATLEVLGFYPRELGAYVFRESFILSLFGIILGIPTGIWLHRFIMSKIQVDMISFNNVIEPSSYIMAVLLVIGFTVIVDLIMRRKLKKISMTEALKSIE